MGSSLFGSFAFHKVVTSWGSRLKPNGKSLLFVIFGFNWSDLTPFSVGRYCAFHNYNQLVGHYSKTRRYYHSTLAVGSYVDKYAVL